MSIRIAQLILVLGICFAFSIAAAATPEEAKELLDEAVSFYHEHGKEKTFAEISNRDGKFRRGELYIFVYDGSGITVAHGGDPNIVGTNALDRQDANGKFFAREIMKISESGGSVDYVWMNHETGTVQPKTSYIVLVDEYRFGCGIYK
jgi:signal transduction histidine kinase